MSMRKINTRRFNRATRTTPGEINPEIVVNVVRGRQPVSRAGRAGERTVTRGMISALVEELIAEGAVCEGETRDTPRGRKPTLLHVRTHDRLVVGADVRFDRTTLVLGDFEGREIARESFETTRSSDELVEEMAERIQRLLRRCGSGECEGIGLVVPGMVDRRTGRILNSPALGWKNVSIREALSAATGLPVYLENAPIACAMGHMWLKPSRDAVDSFVYLTVSDGVGAGVVVRGEVLRGHGGSAGEFGHIPLRFDGPPCMCGQRGCLEAYTSNLATVARYFGLDLCGPADREALRNRRFTMADLLQRARQGDERARSALAETAHYLGIGIAGIVNALNPSRILLGGEITAAWDLIGDTIRAELQERTLTEGAAATPILPVQAGEQPRLLGATALLVARDFAAPQLA
jgi:predicted NBD/HSP70 family sugar kinase